MAKQEQEQRNISIKNLAYCYPGTIRPVINNLSAEFEAGKYYAVLGRNGSGKSTLAGCISSLLAPTGGNVCSCGFDSSLPENSFEILKRVATVFQDPQTQIIGATVEEEVAFGPENLGLESGLIRKRVDTALEMTGITDIAAERPQQLSMGQKQLVSIAGAIAMDPVFIISDESTSMLDDNAKSNVLELFEKLRERGTGIIHITHFLEEAVNADEVIILDNGKIGLQGAPEDVLHNPDLVLDMGLEPLPVTLVTREIRTSSDYSIGNLLTVKELLSWLKY